MQWWVGVWHLPGAVGGRGSVRCSQQETLGVKEGWGGSEAWVGRGIVKVRVLSAIVLLKQGLHMEVPVHTTLHGGVRLPPAPPPAQVSDGEAAGPQALYRRHSRACVTCSPSFILATSSYLPSIVVQGARGTKRIDLACCWRASFSLRVLYRILPLHLTSQFGSFSLLTALILITTTVQSHPLQGLGSWIEIVEERTGDVRNPPRRSSTSRPGGGGGSLMSMIGAQAETNPSRQGQPTQHDDGREQQAATRQEPVFGRAASNRIEQHGPALGFGKNVSEAWIDLYNIVDRIAFIACKAVPKEYDGSSDVWKGIARAKELGWLDPDSPDAIDLEEYEHYDNPGNGDLHMIVPNKIIAFKGPVGDLPDGRDWYDRNSVRSVSFDSWTSFAVADTEL
eukprot:746087-Hanusia_phi.AAC.11